MKVLPQSHTDHVSAETLAWVQEQYKDRTAFFIETVDLPAHLPDLECGLYGPAVGDPLVAEADVFYAPRPGRGYHSRLVDRPARPSRKVSVIAGPFGDDPCVLYTVFGGPAAPKEPGDPAIKSDAEWKQSREFWAAHALAAPK